MCRSARAVAVARELGFSLDEILALLRLRTPGRASCGEVRKIRLLWIAAA
jgi:hypothetical protein